MKTKNKNINNNCLTKFMGNTMKKFFLLLVLVAISFTYAYSGDKKEDNELLRKSNLSEPPSFGPSSTSFPAPFSELTQPRTIPSISTGYYWVDSDERIPVDYKNPDGTSKWDILQSYTDTLYQPGTWTRILPGPRILPKTFWDEHKDDGLPFFRNTANSMDQLVNFFDNSVVGDGALDSTDDAIAGPMPISIAGGFFFNGIRYDSFYVSTNGVIALTNRRYFYDNYGNRIVPAGSMSAYDPMSMDWFLTVTDPLLGCTRCRNFADNGGGFGTGDGVRDDFGYTYSVLGQDPANVTTTPPTSGPSKHLDGIRARGVSFTSLKPNLKQALIAFAWGDMELSQFNPVKKNVDDFGKAYFKRSISADKLVISIFNMQIKGTVNLTYGGSKTFNADLRPSSINPNDGDYVTVDAQIILNGKDSSVTIIYKKVVDRLQYYANYPYSVIRRNTICGVAGWARHVNYPVGVPAPNPNDPTNYPPKSTTPEYFYPYATPALNGEYQQYTVYFDKYRLGGTADDNYEVPKSGTKVMFKQWKNVLRAPDIQYYVRETKDLSVPINKFPVKVDNADNYELFAGVPRIGAIQPVALIQNLTNDIQGPNGINFTPQELNFQVRYHIENQVTQKVIYNRLVPIDQNCLSATASGDPNLIFQYCKDPQAQAWLAANVTKSGSTYVVTPQTNFDGTGYKGIPPYKFVQVYFPPFEPNEFMPSNIGRLRSYVIAEPTTPNQESLGDAWPFDDQKSLNLFVMRRLPSFNDDVTEFHNVYGVNMPSVWKWVNIDAEVVDGEVASENPLPPRGRFQASYEAIFDQNGYITNRTYSNVSINSPEIKMNRITLDGNEPNPASLPGRAGNGDEIRSFPIDLRGQYNSILSVSVQRTLKQTDWPRGWSDRQLIGAEPRVITNGNWSVPYTTASAASASPDELAVEFALPSDDGLNGITNIPDANWSVHPRRFNLPPVGAGSIAKNPAITILGGGGYRVGFLETDKDSALTKEDNANLKPNGLRPNMFDDGIDHQFKKYFVAIPDTFIRWKNEGAYNFRFRLHVFATNDQKCMTCISDDADDFLVDNISINVPQEIPDIEVSSVNVKWPYTEAPASQATSIPITVTLSNNSAKNAPAMSIKLKIFRTDANGNSEKDPIYCRTENISNLNGGRQIEISMPAWNARKSQRDTVASYKLQAMVIMSEKDLNTVNDTNFTNLTLRFGNSFAYDPIIDNPTSNVGDEVGIGGRGLNLFASNYTGGQGWPPIDPVQDAAGTNGGNDGSGEIAVKFTVLNTDTLRGYETFFTGLSRSPEPIQLLTYRDKGGIPGDPNQSIIPYTWIETTRGYGDLLGFEKYVVQEIPNGGVELQPGTYWISIAQLGEYALNLGGSASRCGMRTMNVFIDPNTGQYGTNGNSFNLDPNFRVKNINEQLVNSNYFAAENVMFSAKWGQFSPIIGNPVYPHSDHFGTDLKDGTTQTLQQGTWLPMHRPYFGPRSYGQEANTYQWCSDDLPVELTGFHAEVRTSGIDLFWETASENNNHGFWVEKREGTDASTPWNQIGFQESKGNSTSVTRYSFFDQNVVANQTYQYRLRQVDNDGTQACSASDPVTVTFGAVNEMSLEPNSPNPFSVGTMIKFTLPQHEFTTLDVVDIYGNVIKTLVSEELDGNTYSYTWDGTNQNGIPVSNGTYIYRLTSGSKVLTGKMTLVK